MNCWHRRQLGAEKHSAERPFELIVLGSINERVQAAVAKQDDNGGLINMRPSVNALHAQIPQQEHCLVADVAKDETQTHHGKRFNSVP